METIATENSSNEQSELETAEVCACMLSRRCDAQGLPEDGGHVFDERSEDDPGNSWCHCGMDVITYTCWFQGF